jgi:5-methylcytosine-specific restriction endonuclease McrA
MKVGDICKTNYWGDVEVIETKGWGNRCLVKFLLSGNTKDVRKEMLKKGVLEDTEAIKAGKSRIGYESPQRLAARIPAGAVYSSNFWGDVVVLEYRSSIEIGIQFVESGNKITVQKNALENGLVKDVELGKLRAQGIESKRAVEKAAANLKARIADYPQLLKRLNKKISTSHKQAHKLWNARQGEVDKIFNTFSQVFTHPKYGDYQINSVSEDGSCTVKFFLTGYIHPCMLLVAKRGRVRDYSQFSKDDEKALYREKSATGYLENREARLQQAKDWQKANPEKSRVRNRNRRAKRINAEGTHTEAQTTALLELQDHKCNCCGICLHTTEKHLDHIMPLDLGGSNWIDNLQWLCQFCNNSKGAKHPDEWAAEILTEHWQARRQQRLQAVL